MALSLACTPREPAAERATDAVSVTGRSADGATRLRIRYEGRDVEMTVRRDDTVAPGTEPATIDVIGIVPGTALILADRYPSAPGGLSFCQAGEEQFLRVIALVGDSPRETLTRKVASCRETIELADRGIEWDPAAATLDVHWLTGPAGTSQVLSYRVDNTGTARLTRE